MNYKILLNLRPLFAILIIAFFTAEANSQILIDATAWPRTHGDVVDTLLIESEWVSQPTGFYGYRCEVLIADKWTVDTEGITTYTGYHKVRDSNTIWKVGIGWDGDLSVFDGATRTIRADKQTVDCGNDPMYKFPHFFASGKYHVLVRWHVWNVVNQDWILHDWKSTDVQVELLPPSGGGGPPIAD